MFLGHIQLYFISNLSLFSFCHPYLLSLAAESQFMHNVPELFVFMWNLTKYTCTVGYTHMI